jgi:hypothetical protein
VDRGLEDDAMMKVAVIITNAGQAANCDGGKCETKVITVHTWELLEATVKVAQKNSYNSISLALVEDPA